jgi:hypothetical protein
MQFTQVIEKAVWVPNVECVVKFQRGADGLVHKNHSMCRGSNMGGSKRYMEEQDALRSQVIQIGLESDVLHYCEDDDEAYHDTGATEEAVELGLQKFKAGELEGFDNAQDVRKFIEDTINELPYECTRCEQRAGS